MMNARIETVSPENHFAETRGVTMAAVALGLLWITLLWARQETPSAVVLEPYQASAFETLPSIEHGLFGDLRSAGAEILSIKSETGTWPSVDELKLASVAPFVSDTAWQKRGRHEWSLLDSHGPEHAAYWGVPENAGSPQFVLVLRSGVISVWRRDKGALQWKPSAELPTLTATGWIELLAKTADTP